jgi:hypothetical protein
MAEFDVGDVTRIAREAAREQSTTVRVAGVVLGAGGSDYVEILATWRGAGSNPVSSHSVCSETLQRLN